MAGENKIPTTLKTKSILEEELKRADPSSKERITHDLAWVLQEISQNTIIVGPYPIDLQIAELLGYSNNENFDLKCESCNLPTLR